MKKLLLFITLLAIHLNPVISQVSRFDKEREVRGYHVPATPIKTQQLVNDKSRIGIGEDEKLIFLSAREDKLGYTHTCYQQYHKGIEVEGATYIVHTKDDKVVFANGGLIQHLNINTTPTVSEAQALQMATSHIDITDVNVKLVIFDKRYKRNPNNYDLTYRISDKDQHTSVYVHAHTGEVITTINCMQHGDVPGTGVGAYYGLRNITVNEQGNIYVLKDNARNIQVFYANNKLNHRFIEDSIIADTDTHFDNAPHAVDAFWSLQKIYDYFLINHEQNSYSNGEPIRAWVNWDIDNALWLDSGKIVLGNGDDSTRTHYTSLDMVAHEYMHGIIKYSTTNFKRSDDSEVGALSESYPDIFAVIIEADSLPDEDNWIIGERIVTENGKNGIRNLQNPHDPTMTQAMAAHFDEFGNNKYYNSGISSHAFYLMTNSMGIDSAAQIVYQAISYMSDNAQFIDARIAMITAAEQLYGINSNAAQQTAAAWYAVGIGNDYSDNVSSCREQDSLSLMAIYDATDGENWTRKWDLSLPIDEWRGIKVNEDGCVTCIELEWVLGCTSVWAGGNNLVGTIPPEIGDFRSLEGLFMSGNDFSGGIPPEIGNLTNLTHLAIAGSNLNGPIPPEIGNLTNLVYLNMYGNSLNGSLPSEMGNLTNLEVLALSFNSIEGELPPEMGNLTNLRALNLAYNRLTGQIPASFGYLENLTELRFKSNLLSGCYPPTLTNLCNRLDSVYNSNEWISDGTHLPPWEDFCANNDNVCFPINEECRLQDSLALIAMYNATDGANWGEGTVWDLTQPLDEWRGVTVNEYGCVICLELEWHVGCSPVWVWGIGLSGTLPPEIGDFSSLENLHLSGNDSLVGSIPPEIGNLVHLKSLSLASCGLTGGIPPEIGNLSNLEYINLYHQGINNIPPEIGNATSLEEIHLSFNPLSGNLPSEIGNLTNLRYLNCNYSQLSGSIPAEFGNLENLTYLGLKSNYMSGCYHPNLVNLCGQLDTLSEFDNGLPPWEDFCTNNDNVCLPVDEVCRLQDSLALIALYNATDGANWTNTWDLNQPIDTWYGIGVDENGCVTCIDMYGNVDCVLHDHYYLNSGNNLSGSLPIEIGNLSNLSFLDLNNNNLIGNIPQELENLNNLTHLSLSNNQIDGIIFPEIGNLSSLIDLRLNNNQLSGTIPTEIWNLNNLNRLDLDNNSLNDTIPPIIENLNNLIHLDLSYNQLYGNIPQEIENLNSLSHLNLSFNQLSGNIPPQIGNLLNLIFLRINENQLTGNIPPEIGNLIDMKNLSLSSNQLVGNIPPEIGNLINLTFLSLAANQLSGSIPPEIGNINHLDYLWLRNNNLSGCYDINLINLLVGNNYSVSHYNNFDEPWDDFRASGLGACSDNPYPDCRQSDSLALVAIYNATDGINWTNTWDLSQPLNDWYGVKLNGFGCVAYLNLNSNNLIGSIPSEIGNLINLRFLFLRYNNLSGSIPPEIGNLNGLASLYIDDNYLSGNIPSEIGNLNGLNFLYLKNNKLNGSIPPEIGNLNNLWSLHLENNLLIGSIPSEIENINNLRFMLLYGNDLSGCYASNLSNLCNQLNPSYNTNYAVSDRNDLPSWEDFCNTGAGSCAPLTCAQTDSLALVAFYNSTNGANWTNPWDLTQAMSTWQGVSIVGGCVTQLILYGRGLTGTLPPEIGNLQSLSYLDLNNNDIGGEIPVEIGNMVSLTLLSMADNEFIGPIPTEIGNLSELYHLNLGGSELTGGIPSQLGNLQKLVYCKLSGNPLGGGIPVELGNLTQLEKLFISYCELTDTIPKELGNLQNLEWLIARTNEFEGKVPVELGNLVNATIIRLDENNLTDTIPSELGNLQQLLMLALNANGLTGSIPPNLGNMSSLEQLWLFSNSLTGEIPSQLGNLSNLNQLWLNSNNLSGSIPVELRNLTALTSLYLHYNSLSGNIPPELSELTNIRQLILNNNVLTGEIPATLGSLIELESLRLGANMLSGHIPAELGNLINLDELWLYSNDLTGNVPLEFVNLANLRNLWLHRNRLYGEIPSGIGSLPKMKQIWASENKFTFKGFESLVYADITSFHYSVQDTILPTISLGNQLSVDAGGTIAYNTYKWYRDGALAATIVGDSTYTPDVAGTYYCRVSNAVITDPTEYHHNFTLRSADFDFDPSSLPVYPGDFNVDGIVNSFDALYWGWASGQQGIARDNTSIVWEPYIVDDWQYSVAGVNNKHQDGDGNGIINQDDLQAIIANYDSIRPIISSNRMGLFSEDYILEFELIEEIDTDDNKKSRRYNIYLRHVDGEPVVLHGVAFDIAYTGYDEAPDIRIDIDNSSLGDSLGLVQVFNTSSKIFSVGISQQDQIPDTLTGPVAQLVLDEIWQGGDDKPFALFNGTGGIINVAEDENYPVNGQEVIVSPDNQGGELGSTLAHAIVTQPTCNRFGSIEIQAVNDNSYTYSWSHDPSNHTNIALGLASGVYDVTVTEAGKQPVVFEIVLSVSESCSNDILLEVDIILEGVYQDEKAIIMKESLQKGTLIPKINPYKAYYSALSTVLKVEGENAPVDWLLIQLRDVNDWTTTLYETPVILQRNGRVVNADGTYPVRLTPPVKIDSFYLVVEHRNHLPVMYAEMLEGTYNRVDFTKNDSYNANGTGTGQKEVNDNIWVMIAGNADDNNYDLSRSDKTTWTSDNGFFGFYLKTDFNLDGDINGEDKIYWELNNGKCSATPQPE